MHRILIATLAALLLAAAQPVQAANTPCSGRKGGIAQCQGDTFICNDGSISASKKSCQAYLGGSSRPATPQSRTPAAAGECSCRSGTYCTGPRGGVYCLSDNGRKSYVRSNR